MRRRVREIWERKDVERKSRDEEGEQEKECKLTLAEGLQNTHTKKRVSVRVRERGHCGEALGSVVGKRNREDSRKRNFRWECKGENEDREEKKERRRKRIVKDRELRVGRKGKKKERVKGVRR
ncbi:hypothetical protein Tco_0096994 [Tanacetum coccineum]